MTAAAASQSDESIANWGCQPRKQDLGGATNWLSYNIVNQMVLRKEFSPCITQIHQALKMMN
jgi:hypothetical protein